ncbi:MAG: hypothetical protein [Grapevine-associated levi-like virus 10]|uniref:Uncharacterized protein n=2 Tax=Fiersviridae TaxID=2842319 RepID=A0A8F5MLB6_9VIRU|nr:MAG: hypothetical protein [Grapevine-associated levi-like virus 10]QXN75350.1 MAG: RNA-dependent RNA polymerase [Grapevine-associated levi-like virus 11]
MKEALLATIYYHEVKRNEQREYNGDNVLSGLYVNDINTMTGAHNRSDLVRGSYTYEGIRDATDYDRIDWSLESDSPFQSDTRNTLPGYAGGVVKTQYLSTFGFQFTRTLVNEDFLLTENARSEARTKCLQDSKGRSDRMQLGANLGELSKTLDMFTDNATLIANALTAARHGRWGNIPRLLRMERKNVLTGKYPANKWLEYQYGWKPLYNDLYTGYNKLTKQSNLPMLVYFRGASRPVEIDREIFNDGNLIGMQKGTFGARCVCVGKVVSETAFGLAQNGLLNPLSVAWELVPFSFALDWFVPVGAALDGLTSTAGLQFVMGFEDWRTKFANTWSYGHNQANVVNYGDMVERYSRFTRYRRTHFPFPELYVDRNPLRGPRAANALALFRGLFR